MVLSGTLLSSHQSQATHLGFQERRLCLSSQGMLSLLSCHSAARREGRLSEFQVISLLWGFSPYSSAAELSKFWVGVHLGSLQNELGAVCALGDTHPSWQPLRQSVLPALVADAFSLWFHHPSLPRQTFPEVLQCQLHERLLRNMGKSRCSLPR